MRKMLLATAFAIMTAAGAYAFNAGSDIKLPKCSMTLCRAVNCSADTLCVKGAHVTNCADVCSNGAQ
jgi:hypothetical protein